MNWDSLLLEYHNIGQEVLKTNKYFLEQLLSPYPSTELDKSSSRPSQQFGPSNPTKHTEDSYAQAEPTLYLLNNEERLSLRRSDANRSSGLESDRDGEYDEDN